MNGGAKSEAYLLFRSRSRVGALVLSDVREVMRPLPVETIPGAPALVMGVAVIRGIPSPVIDAARLMADATDSVADRSAPTRFISLKLGARGACLAVDAVLDVRVLPAEQFHQTPPLLGGAGAQHLPFIGAVDRELLIVLNAARMLPESVWTSMQDAEQRG